MACIVVATGTDYEVYSAETQFINVLLGPATVALAVPLVRSARRAVAGSSAIARTARGDAGNVMRCSARTDWDDEQHA